MAARDLSISRRRIADEQRKRIEPDEKVPLKLDNRERELILRHTFADSLLTNRLQLVPLPGQSRSYYFSLGDLDDLAGYVAAEANHAEKRALARDLHNLCARIFNVLDSYTEQDA